MVNKTKFYKTKVALAVVLSLSLAACGDSDGDAGSTTTASSDATQNTVGNQNELSGTVQGVVVDSNANPLEGVKVYLGAAETVTNAGGQYVFTNVAVTNVSGVNNEGDEANDSITQKLIVTIGGTAEYLGALVTVTPQAQVNNTGGQGVPTGADGASGGNGVDCTPGVGGSTSSTVTNSTTDNNTGQTTTVTVTTTTVAAIAETAPGAGDAVDKMITEVTETVVTDGATVVSTNTTTTSSVGDGGSCAAGDAGAGGAGGNASNGSNSQVTAQTFIDGFTAEAGVAVLPTLDAGAYGYIRDCRTGAPLLDTADLLSLDFLSLSEDVFTDVGGNNGSLLTNAEDTHTISSDDNGMFSLTGLAANSSYAVTAKKGYVITTAGAGTTVIDSLSVSTGSEGSSELMGTIEVCPVSFTGNDVSVAPMIKSIDGQIGTTTVGSVPTRTTDFAAGTIAAQYAALNQGIVNDFVINFTEEMASTFNLTEARVQVIAPGTTLSATVADATVTLSADGTSATVTFVTDLAEGSKVDVWFPHWTALDANDSKFLVDNTGLKYDTIGLAITTGAKAVYSHAYFCTFAKPSNTASVVLGPQIFDAVSTEDGNSTDLAEYSTAFQDNFEATANTATQLNDGDVDSATRLQALAFARDSAASTTVSITQDYAVVSFDGTNASSLIWKLNGVVVTTGTTIAPAGNGIEIHTDALGVTTAHIQPAKHNDVITATPVNGFSDVITAGTMSVTLVDAIAPTTVLQESYNITDASGPRATLDLVDGSTANASFGNGGEISAPGTTATAAGEPIIHIQPRHLAGQTDLADDRNNELNSLTADMANRLTAAEVTALGGAVPALAAVSVTTYATGAFETPIYDATAYANWADVSAKIGVAFNEDVTLTTTAPAFSGSTTLSGYAALNDVAANVDGQVVAVDLVTFDTPSVVALSLDAGADLGFVGSVTDSRANTSTANAQVFIQDTFPPMMTAAIWNGETLELTFNEAPVIHAGTPASITILDPTDTDQFVTIGVIAANTAIVGNVMTITLDGTENVAASGLFQAGANNEFAYDDDASATNNLPEGEQHALIDWDNIADATGNQWSEFNPMTSVSNRGMETNPVLADTRRWEVVAPRFLAVDAVGVFSYAVTTNGYFDAEAELAIPAPDGDDDGLVTYTIAFTHPIDVSATLNSFSTHINDHPTYNTDVLRAGAITVNTSDANGVNLLNDLFSVSVDGISGTDTFVSNVAGPSATTVNGSFALSADHKTITLAIQGSLVDADSIVFGATTFGFQTTVTSAITGSVTTFGNFNWQNNN